MYITQLSLFYKYLFTLEQTNLKLFSVWHRREGKKTLKILHPVHAQMGWNLES